MEINSNPETRTERRKNEVRQKIVRTAVDLFERQGFHNTTMEQIAQEADIARKTLYNYFPVKEAIADEYVRGISKGLAENTEAMLAELPDTRAKLTAALSNTYSWVEINPEITAICLGYRRSSSHYSKEKQEATGTQSLIAKILQSGQENGEIRADLSVKQLGFYIEALRGTMVFEWLKQPARSDLHEEIDKLVELFLYGAAVSGRQEKRAE